MGLEAGDLGLLFPFQTPFGQVDSPAEKEVVYPHYTAWETESGRMGGVASLWHGNPAARGDLNS